jgi:hypothetical protein
MTGTGPTTRFPVLTNLIAALTPAEIVDFYRKRIEVADTAYRNPLWNAAFLIEGGCGDDGFMDFRDGLILQGRETFHRAVANPDCLADLPVVVRMSRNEGGWIGFESLSYLVREAYRRTQGETDSLMASLDAAMLTMARPTRPAGEDWDPEDEHETRHRLPRLAALFLG